MAEKIEVSCDGEEAKFELGGGLVFGRDQGGCWCWWVTREGREQDLAPSVEPKVRHGFLQKPNDELYCDAL